LDLSISIVNFNTKYFLEKSLLSIYKNTRYIDFEVFIVDNGSTDGSAEMVRNKFSKAKLIVNKENVGFARANNQVIKESKGRYILLLNSDTEVLPSTFELMVKFMDSHAEVGALGCKLLNPDGSLQRSCRSFPNFLTLFLESTFLDQVFFRKRFFGGYQMTYWDHDDIREVDQPMGACLMVRRKAVEDVGLLDEDFFMFFEEVDWCSRIKERGWKIYFLPHAKVIHYGGQSIKKLNLPMFFTWHKSRYRYFRKRYPHIPPILLKIILIGCSSLQLIIILVVLYGIYRLVIYGISNFIGY